MAKSVTLYHVKDGPVEIRSAYVDDTLRFPDEWSRKPWDASQAPASEDDGEGDSDEPVKRGRSRPRAVPNE